MFTRLCVSRKQIGQGSVSKALLPYIKPCPGEIIPKSKATKSQLSDTKQPSDLTLSYTFCSDATPPPPLCAQFPASPPSNAVP